MKAVLLGNDFIKDTDSTFKMLETNTNLALPLKPIASYINKDVLDQFLLDNGITDIDLIVPSLGIAASIDYDNSEISYSLLQGFIIQNYGESHNVRLWTTKGDNIPTVEDAPNKLILRISYDTNALVDDTYCRDNFNFLKLMYDSSPNSIPATYFNDGGDLTIDGIGTSFRDNGNYPNLIIKKRYPTTDYLEYPKIFKVTTSQELIDIKNSLSSDEILQEYIVNTNDLLEGKTKTYRHLSLVYGSDLSVLDLFEPFVHTNKVALSETIDYVGNEIQVWERPKLLQKIGNYEYSNSLHGDSNDTVILSDGTTTTLGSLSVGDEVKSLDIYSLPDDEMSYNSWSGVESDVFNNTIPTTSSVTGKISKPLGLFVNVLGFDNGLTISNVKNTIILTKTSEGNIKFTTFDRLNVGSQVVFGSLSDDSLSTATVESISYQFKHLVGNSIDVEEEDVYLVLDDQTNPTYYTIHHNNKGLPSKGGCGCWYKEQEFYDCFCEEPCLYSEFECEWQPTFIECCGRQPNCMGSTDRYSFSSGFCGDAK
jgi:hypothetical protein